MSYSSASFFHLITPRRVPVCSTCLRKARRQFRLQFGLPRAVSIASPATLTEPFRKQLKDEAKARKLDPSFKGRKKSKPGDARLDKWELTVGLEIHAELNTARKLFSGAATSTLDAPNSHVALFDLSFPGTQPQFQKETLLPALRAALALNCSIQRSSSFDRKHYFYQDQPAGYQITQFYAPLARDGHIILYDHDGIAPEDGAAINVDIKQIQMEQDTAKTLQQPPSTHLLDFNRVSHPLIEIITLPQIHHPSTAAACVRKIQAILRSVNATTTGMEMGGLRADVNISVRERRRVTDNDNVGESYHGITGLGQRTEIKNLSSVKAVEDAIIAEMNRQIDVLEARGVIQGETRGWTLGGTVTKKLRGKEGEVDYRYMPDPDLGEVIIGDDLVQHLRNTLPMLPDAAVDMIVGSKKYGLTKKDAKTLVVLDDGSRLEYYMDVVDLVLTQSSSQEQESWTVGKDAGNWVLHELGGLFTTAERNWSDSAVPSTKLAAILLLLFRKQITRATAKQLLAGVFDGDDRPVEQIVEDNNLLLRPLSEDEYMALALAVVSANPGPVNALLKGQRGKLMYLVGQVMREGEEGRVEALKAEAVIRDILGLSSQ